LDSIDEDMMKLFSILSGLAALSLPLLAASATFADTATVTINKISAEGVGAAIGKATITDGKDGAVIAIEVSDIAAGEHGLHVHEKGDCGPGEKDGKKLAGFAAGPHFDPAKTGHHAGPAGAGHMGDLPKLMATAGTTKVSLVAPHVKVADIAGRALMIHEAGDSYSDTPEFGGGKARIACGVIQAAK
jgi:Cu-Zn family superoxide dismutase